MRSTHSNANDGRRHIEEDVEAGRVGCVGGDDEDDGDGVDRARLGHDPGFPRKTERLARVAHCALAGPEAISDEHYRVVCVSGERRMVTDVRYERVQIPFMAVVQAKKDVLIFCCLSIKTESAFVRLDRPSTEAMPVPVSTSKTKQLGNHVLRSFREANYTDRCQPRRSGTATKSRRSCGPK